VREAYYAVFSVKSYLSALAPVLETPVSTMMEPLVVIFCALETWVAIQLLHASVAMFCALETWVAIQLPHASVAMFCGLETLVVTKLAFGQLPVYYILYIRRHMRFRTYTFCTWLLYAILGVGYKLAPVALLCRSSLDRF
jgi:hypothetical protein